MQLRSRPLITSQALRMSEIRGLTYCALSDTQPYPMPYQSLSTDLTPYMLCSLEEKAKGLVFGGRLFLGAAADHSGRGVDRNVRSTRNSKSKLKSRYIVPS